MEKSNDQNLMGAMGSCSVIGCDPVSLAPYIPLTLVHSSLPQNSISTQEIKAILTKQRALA